MTSCQVIGGTVDASTCTEGLVACIDATTDTSSPYTCDTAIQTETEMIGTCDELMYEEAVIRAMLAEVIKPFDVSVH